MQAVVGPARVSKAVSPLREQGNALLGVDGAQGSPLANVGRVGRSLARATAGVSQVRGGISEAADGAGLLAEGLRSAPRPAPRALARGLGRATGGTRQLIDALEAFEAGHPAARPGPAQGRLREHPAEDRAARTRPRPPPQRPAPLPRHCRSRSTRTPHVEAAAAAGAGAGRRRTAEGGAPAARRDDGRQSRPELRGGARRGAARRSPRSAAPTRSAASLPRPNTPACRPNWRPCRHGCSAMPQNAKKSPPTWSARSRACGNSARARAGSPTSASACSAPTRGWRGNRSAWSPGSTPVGDGIAG